MGAFRLCSVSATHAVLEILGVCLTTAHGFNKREARRDRGHSEGPPGGQAQAWDKHRGQAQSLSKTREHHWTGGPVVAGGVRATDGRSQGLQLGSPK